jgi:hypothetical protein
MFSRMRIVLESLVKIGPLLESASLPAFAWEGTFPTLYSVPHLALFIG